MPSMYKICYVVQEGKEREGKRKQSWGEERNSETHVPASESVAHIGLKKSRICNKAGAYIPYSNPAEGLKNSISNCAP